MTEQPFYESNVIREELKEMEQLYLDLAKLLLQSSAPEPGRKIRSHSENPGTDRQTKGFLC